MCTFLNLSSADVVKLKRVNIFVFWESVREDYVSKGFIS